MTDEWLVPPPRDPLHGEEAFVGMPNANVYDFWRFALGDLRMNNARGYLAEFIVGRALGLDKVQRVEWDAFDIAWEGITIEVKSSAYLQAWEQRVISTIKFSGLKGRRYSPRGDLEPGDPGYNAMVYVFCVNVATDHHKYEPLDLNQWKFYVVRRSALAERDQKSAGIKRVSELSGGDVPWADLKQAVRAAAVGEKIDRDAARWW